MPNYLAGIEQNYKKAQGCLQEATLLLERCELDAKSPLQSLVVTDEMAQLFREKPVILIQQMNINIIQVFGRIQEAIRLFERIEAQRQKELVLRRNGVVKTRRGDKCGLD